MVDSRLTRTTGLDATPRLGLRTRLGQTHRWRKLAILRQMPTPTCWHRATDSCITQISARSISHRQYVNAGIRPPQTTNKQPCILVSIIYRVQPRLCCRACRSSTKTCLMNTYPTQNPSRKQSFLHIYIYPYTKTGVCRFQSITVHSHKRAQSVTHTDVRPFTHERAQSVTYSLSSFSRLDMPLGRVPDKRLEYRYLHNTGKYASSTNNCAANANLLRHIAHNTLVLSPAIDTTFRPRTGRANIQIKR